MSLLAAVSAIKDALSSKDLGAFLNHYLIADGELVATDGKITAGYPLDCGVAALVPGPEFEGLVGKLEGDVSVRELDGRIELSGDNISGTIKVLPPGTVAFMRPEGTWKQPPKNFVEALRTARPFIADQAVHMWSLCACLRDGAILASNNISLVEVECFNLEVGRDVLVPRPAVDFVLGAKADLVGYLADENHAGFIWSDGLWLRTQLVVGDFPASAASLLADKKATPIEMTRAWKRGYRDVSDLSEAVVTVAPTEVVGGKGKAEVRCAIATKGLDREVYFNPKFLDNVVGVAESWDPQAWPRVPFRGKNLYGIVVGRQK